MNAANLLTFSRFILIGVYFFVFYNKSINNNLIWSLIIFLIAGITDILDGYIARKYDLITNWGKLMDPLADKLMLLAVLISLWTVSIVPSSIMIIVLAKEFLMIIGAIYVYKNKDFVVQANIIGKVASFSFYVAIVALVLDIPYAIYILGIAVTLTIIAFIQYGILNIIKAEDKIK